MKRILFTAFLFALLGSGSARSQVTLEFGLKLRMESHNFHDTLTFGYDPSATDGCDKNLGENSDYPPLGFNDFVMVNNDSSFHDMSTKVDYRHKPTAASFELDYKWSTRSENFPFTISWTPSAIPAIIKHIYLVPAPAQSVILADLKKQSSVTITTDSMIYYQDCILKLLYNEETNAVASNGALPTGLLTALASSPNPFQNVAHISFNLAHVASLSVKAFDEAGRLVSSERLQGTLGMNQLSLTPTGKTQGPLFVRVEATAGSSSAVQTITLIRQ